MNTIADLNPDVALAALLDGKVSIDYGSQGGVQTVPCYAAGVQPEKGLPKSFISVEWNGGAQSLTEDPALFKGNLMLIVYCQMLNSTTKGQTVNTGRVRKLLAQVAPLVHRKVSRGFVFSFDPTNVITPTTPNLTTGYSTTILNVEWHVTDEFFETITN
jgi:hypothetical protein|nr:MAG TPA: hypothetical protein [Caudoviricetes sp.]